MAATRRRIPSATPTDVADFAGWPWAALLLLGAAHGINPGMGWLFAVATGLQEQRDRAVWRALLPLAAGHFLAVAAAIALAMVIGRVITLEALKWIVATSLITFGVYRLQRHRHPRYGGMRMSMRELTVWSFLMATVHGAGLMAVPFVLGAAGTPGGGGAHAAHGGTGVPGAARGVHALHASLGGDQLALLATLVHTASYLLVTGIVALVVYRRLGLRVLRRGWVNLDVIWAGALIVTGVVALLV